MGERTPLALLDAPASGRMAVAEALTNIVGGRHRRDSSDVRLSANWMAACGEPGEDADLYAHRAGGGRGVLPGARHHDSGRQGFAVDEDRVDATAGARRKVVAPVSLIVSAFAPVRRCAPHADAAAADRSRRHFAAADRSRRRAQSPRRLVPRAGVRQRWVGEAPDCDDPARSRSFFAAIVELRAAGLLLAYHDRSDGGLFATLAEMAFAGPLRRRARSGRGSAAPSRQRCSAKSSARCCRFARSDAQAVRAVLAASRARALRERDRSSRRRGSRAHSRAAARSCSMKPRTTLRRAWSETSFRMRRAARQSAAARASSSRRRWMPTIPA